MIRTRYTCPIAGCNQTFGRQRDCSRHVDEKHGEPKPCPVAGCNWKKARRKGRLEAHLKKSHSDIYNLELDITPLSTSQTSASNYSASQDNRGSYYQSSEALPTSTTYNYQSTAAAASYIPAYYQTASTSTSSYGVSNQVQGGSGGAAATMQTNYAITDDQAGYDLAGSSDENQDQAYYPWSPDPNPPA